MRTFLLSVLVFSSVASAELKFQYIPSKDGKAVLKGECASESSCKFTEVWLGQATDLEEQIHMGLPREFDLHLLRSGKVTPEEKLKMLTSLKESPIDFEKAKELACKRDPKEFFPFRAAFHKGYNEFVASINEYNRKVCKAKDPEAFFDLAFERSTYGAKVCDLKYVDTTASLKRKSDTEWSAVLSPSTGPHKRPEVLDKCYDPFSFDLKCQASDLCQVRMGFKKRSFSRIFASQEDPCKSYPEKLEFDFSASHMTQLPSHCRFLLDRHRDSDCCAFEPPGL